ncbi:hypothetical protein [Streptomyces sp. NPDC002403]
MTTAPLAVTLPSITLPVTITVGGMPCQAGTITTDPTDTHGSISRCLADFLRDVADVIEQTTSEEVTTDGTA